MSTLLSLNVTELFAECGDGYFLTFILFFWKPPCPTYLLRILVPSFWVNSEYSTIFYLFVSSCWTLLMLHPSVQLNLFVESDKLWKPYHSNVDSIFYVAPLSICYWEVFLLVLS